MEDMKRVMGGEEGRGDGRLSLDLFIQNNVFYATLDA